MYRSIATMLAVGAFAVGLGTTQPFAQEIKIKAASFVPEQIVVAKYFYQWTRETNKRCIGKLEISVVGPAAIPTLEQWSALKNGVIDMAYTPANYYRGAVPEGDVFAVAKNTPLEQRKNGAWELINKLHNEKLNAWYLTNLYSGIEFFFYTTKPAVKGRLDGFRIRSVPLYDEALEKLGANPVRLAPPAIYTSIERGTVDGYGWPSWGIADLGLNKLTKYRYGPGFFSAATPIFVNLDTWKRMTEAQRQCLTDATIWLEEVWPKWMAEEDKVQEKVLKDAGIAYHELDAGIMRSVENQYWESLAKANPEFVNKVRPLMSKK